MIFSGGCYCGEVRYGLHLGSLDDARTSLCHCNSCKVCDEPAMNECALTCFRQKFFGTAFGLTAKIPKDALHMVKGHTKEHISDNGSTTLHREFCNTCGSGILEYGEDAASRYRYIMIGTLDQPDQLPPKGEFFCQNRSSWLPEVPGVFHKQKIQE
ncbi:hypothetical protein BDW22DRAFT_1335764 [Trametopsis cervina]|nr:hypothetical protein BDW22DRAFT_1335764 [Trametopsis cervina]